MKIEVQPIDAAQTYALRGALLRPNHPIPDLINPGDDAPTTLHLGAFYNQEIVGIASIYHERWPQSPNSNAYRLRGMAVEPRFQRCGVGGALVRVCLSHVEAQNSEMLWCNARVVALEFYLSRGFESVGEPFEIPEVGPHFLMRRVLK